MKKISILSEISVSGLGFISLGAGAALATSLLVSRARVSMSGSYLIVALMPLIFSGAAMFMLPPFRDNKSLGFYPVGLLLALMWLQAGPLLADVTARQKPIQLMIYAYGLAILILSIAAVAGVFLLNP
ncbi:hypothetical protein [Pseudomonas syringae]|uniref:hypothetical protein n=1 Tax=Pseudomonas syringae TaxID=317 RepID=UPI001187322E|nr:hypothetical protein [Pseudomonas syringae]MBI6707774.1 hypothetical protein [Pseudomonas syringae]MBI6783692.1 hypothetical protein [Pseudomonas syringae]MDU8599961.1 hypothetical protein [Pseudomonas syringae]